MFTRTIWVAVLAAVLIAGCGKKPESPGPAQSSMPEHRSLKKMTVEEAKSKAPFKVLVPAYLPEGVKFVETRYVEYGDDTYVVLQYQFAGKEGRYFQVDEYPPRVREMPMPGTEEIQVGDHKGEAVFQHGFTMVRWTQDGTRLMVNGAIGRVEAMKVAQSFK